MNDEVGQFLKMSIETVSKLSGFGTSFELSLPDGGVDLADRGEGRHVIEVAGVWREPR